MLNQVLTALIGSSVALATAQSAETDKATARVPAQQTVNQAKATSKIGCTHPLGDRDREQTEKLRNGTIDATFIKKRLEKMKCFSDALKAEIRAGWKAKPLTVALENLVMTDEGFEHDYMGSLPLIQEGKEPWETKVRIRKFLYHIDAFEERITEITTSI